MAAIAIESLPARVLAVTLMFLTSIVVPALFVLMILAWIGVIG